MPLFEGRLRMRICGGGAAGSESSWITTPVRTTEPPELKLDFLIKEGNKYVTKRQCDCEKFTITTFDMFTIYYFSYFASRVIFSFASSLLSIS